jgi:hypothetical protein
VQGAGCRQCRGAGADVKASGECRVKDMQSAEVQVQRCTCRGHTRVQVGQMRRGSRCRGAGDDDCCAGDCTGS